MERKLVLEFTKMNGAGNDFIVIDNRFYHFTDVELAGMARRFCPRRTGIGADGVLALSLPADAAHHYRMRYFNADGSRGTMCGNGARCLARFAREAGIGGEAVTFESEAGIYRARVPADPALPVRLYVPPPRDFTADKPLADSQAPGAVHYIWTGTEHAVCFTEAVGAVPVEERGRAIRHDAALAPAGANVNFVQVDETRPDGTGVLRVRTFEKGVEAETLACGTGALAAALVARLLERVQSDRVEVQMPGGTLKVGYRLSAGIVEDLYLEGPAVYVFRGSVEV